MNKQSEIGNNQDLSYNGFNLKNIGDLTAQENEQKLKRVRKVIL